MPANISASQSNSTTGVIIPIDIGELCQLIVTIIFGVVIVILNFIVCATIGFFKTLRERTELIVLSTLASADIILGSGYILMSVQVLMIKLTNDYALVKPLDCMKRVSNTFALVGTEFLTLMMLVVSFDRLLSIANVKYYSRLGIIYLLTALGSPTLVVLCSYATAWLSAAAMPPDPTAPSVCFLNFVTSKTYYFFHNFVQVFGAVGSVLIYSLVILLLRRRMRRVTKAEMDAVERRQVKLTKTVGFMSLCTLILYVVPNVIIIFYGYVYKGPPETATSAIVVARTFTSAYSFCNIVVFLLRPSDVRSHMKIVWDRLRFCGNVVEPAAFSVPLRTCALNAAAPPLLQPALAPIEEKSEFKPEKYAVAEECVRTSSAKTLKTYKLANDNNQLNCITDLDRY